ncbi:hypothetical protein UY3_12895 [Chelonia mydas]|uniref:Uncharacterized protein n=1 Tax=Chelonia mydas TaxID=8469 RepID=M7B3D7_CHEMY|nr:hypothetical protein UY3_12895 [Chelonia mydas]
MALGVHRGLGLGAIGSGKPAAVLMGPAAGQIPSCQLAAYQQKESAAENEMSALKPFNERVEIQLPPILQSPTCIPLSVIHFQSLRCNCQHPSPLLNLPLQVLYERVR